MIYVLEASALLVNRITVVTVILEPIPTVSKKNVKQRTINAILALAR